MSKYTIESIPNLCQAGAAIAGLEAERASQIPKAGAKKKKRKKGAQDPPQVRKEGLRTLGP